ncbi:hypothetical protein M514_13547 [Trichuris suis]|nr:hypothetical protein M514_13547 [Trichuris suis]
MCLSSPYTIRVLFLKVKIYQTSKDVITVGLVCRIPFEQFLKEGGAKYEYTWSGWNSAADKQLRATSSKSKSNRHSSKDPYRRFANRLSRCDLFSAIDLVRMTRFSGSQNYVSKNEGFFHGPLKFR